MQIVSIKELKREVMELVTEKKLLSNLPFSPERAIRTAQILSELAILEGILAQELGQKEKAPAATGTHCTSKDVL